MKVQQEVVADAAVGGVDPRKLRTREAIIVAAQKIFVEQSPENVSVDELARAAGVSKQTFYNHFTEKEELIREIRARIRSKLDALVFEANRNESDPAKRLSIALCIYAKQSIADPALGRLMARLPFEDLRLDSQSNLPAATDIREGLMQGRLAMFSVDTGLAFVFGVGEGLLSSILRPEGGPTASVISHQFVTLLLRAFGLPPLEAETIAAYSIERVFEGG
ncbi:TetR/AcrR family transcriptional regulator [Pseudomonas gingeri]|uniref:TetR/AcrR family transcriptional regulator n=1 Tax=Pseudomonas gingeri TaxID=117681 RepID=A0A7Y7XDZ2_9PSED|nr:TetR/AcrR family transcriptional regulator [Pseudomonas gingeri]NWB97017.1 TetR/AcrR family transcriptional regulator [Pseudomonas gingeri]